MMRSDQALRQTRDAAHQIPNTGAAPKRQNACMGTWGTPGSHLPEQVTESAADVENFGVSANANPQSTGVISLDAINGSHIDDRAAVNLPE